MGTRDLGPLSSHLGRETAASTYLTGDVGLSETTHEECLKTVATRSALQLFPDCTSSKSKATRL